MHLQFRLASITEITKKNRKEAQSRLKLLHRIYRSRGGSKYEGTYTVNAGKQTLLVWLKIIEEIKDSH